MAFSGNAKENKGIPGGRTGNPGVTPAAACSPSAAQTDLDINNVRTTILAGGDMWWDLEGAKYEIPKDGGAHSIFAGSLWIGGLDAGGQLKVAAMTYRQTGNDFWPGPLDTTTASITSEVCDAWDKHFKITLREVEDFVAWKTDPTSIPGYSIPQSILNWPGNGDASRFQGHYMAPFVDVDSDGLYDPNAGDYPGYDLTGEAGCAGEKLFGDQTLWWVFNDKGNIHTETGAEAIGLEIQAQAFAFTTGDEINNMTFYKYKVINRSTYAMNNTYFGQWVDPDLGKYDDDYVGCDVGRGLGYCYNGNASDGSGAPGEYGANPPAVGVDFFQGPLADPGDGIDNDRDFQVDEGGEQIIMSKFVYYNNINNTPDGNPNNGSDIYNYLRGIWLDNLPMTYGGNGRTGSLECDFMFPGNSDPIGWGTNGIPQAPWDEASVGNTPADRRFLQSAGGFTLEPGAINFITTGVVWARANGGGAQASVELMRITDDKAQALFDNCFQVLNGPTAPDLTIQELDKELILTLDNDIQSNNYLENYLEVDPIIQALDTNGTLDTTFNFEGYQIYQLKSATVTQADLYNPDMARLVAQTDVKNGVTQLVNFTYDESLGGNVPQEMVNGSDQGIVHSFRITEDAFATGNTRLVNHKTYYYMVLAYGYNEYLEYDQNDPNGLIGQKAPYKQGRKNIKVYTATPHIPTPEAGGTHAHAGYGQGPKITRVEGQGNGGNILDLTQSTIDAILNSPTHSVRELTYENGRGPVNIKVVDPLNVPDANFELSFSDVTTNSSWVLKDLTNGATYSSVKSISIANEQVIPALGLSVTIAQVAATGTTGTFQNGFLEGTATFSDPSKPWLIGVPDFDGYSPFNWIRSGTQSASGGNPCDAAFSDVPNIDEEGFFEKILSGTWAPYRLAASTDANLCTFGPAFGPNQNLNLIKNLASVDIVFTADKSKWTRSCVLETGDEPALTEGGAAKLNLRAGASVDKNGSTATGPDNNDFPTGMGWFPGYAINVETGERLNIAFGEDSWLVAENGRDMKWNPTSNFGNQSQLVFGGKHYIYVFGHNADEKWGSTDVLAGVRKDVPKYDSCYMIYKHLQVNNSTKKREVFTDAMWVSMPILNEGRTLLENDVKIRLRVAKPYTKYWTTPKDTAGAGSTVVNAFKPLYRFSTSDLLTHTNDTDVAKDALSLINVVPNPYYAYSGYETNQLDNRIKIVNLPEKCNISIFTVNGTLVRKFKKDDPITSLDWDLKNQAGIPVASGLYIIHVDVPGVGERTLKWFGVMRPIDLDSF